MEWMRLGKRLVQSACALGILAELATGDIARAEQTLQSWKEPLPVEMGTSIDTKTAHYGDVFEATLAETVVYEGHVLPKGTVLRGQVDSAHSSYRFGFPGYAAFSLKEAQLPDGRVIALGTDNEGIESRKVRDERAVTLLDIVKAGIPFSALSAAESIPLKYAAGWSTPQIIPVSLATRMILGASLEATKSEKAKHSRRHDPKAARIGHGMFRGTGLTGAYALINIYPEPNLQAGAPLNLHFGEEAMHSLFAGLPVDAENVVEAPSGDMATPIDSDSQTFEHVHGKISDTPVSEDLPKTDAPSADE